MDLDDVILNVHRLLLENMPAHGRQTPSGWTTFNCVMCNDRRKRAGIIQDGAKISYNCFNCGYKTGWTPGIGLSRKYKELATVMGADVSDLNAVQLELLKHSEDLGGADFTGTHMQYNKFTVIEQPPDAIPVEDLPEDDPVRQYALERGVYGLKPLWKIDTVLMRKRLTVPCYYNGNLVGFIGRHIEETRDKKTPKYLHDMSKSFVYNLDPFMDTDREIMIVTEGVFDALLIDGVAVLGNHVTDDQAKLINKSGCRVILCPDRDEPGRELIKQAMHHGWEVSFPPWETGVKDAADAVEKYGRLATVQSIIRHSTNNSVKIEVQSKLL